MTLPGVKALVNIVLKQRIVTALILAAALIAAVIYLPLLYIAALFGCVVLLAAWEWSRLASLTTVPTRICFVMLILVGLVFLFRICGFHQVPDLERIQSIFGVACVWWAIALLWLMGYPHSAQLWGTHFMRILMGCLVLLPAWLGMVYLLSRDGGAYLVLAVVIIVAAADIGAYFVGIQWGRRKLAPEASPGKSWEGFFGGLATSVLGVLIMWFFAGMGHVSLMICVVVGALTSLSSVIGDLTVSMVKRRANVKDSGSILPGHGGILDRIDGLTPAVPVFSLGLMLAGI